MKRRGRILLCGLAAACCLLIAPATAGAHALLQSTEPQRGAELTDQPELVSFTFSEPVESAFGALRVFDSSGKEVQAGEIQRPGGDGKTIATGLEPGLSHGTYTAVYRVISADSHPVSGGFVFSIGQPDQGGAPISKLLDDQSGPGTDSAAFVADRWVGYASLAVLAGSLLFLIAAWRPSLRPEAEAASIPFEHRSRRIAGLACLAGLISAALSLPLQASAAAGVSIADGFDADLIGQVLDTRFGTVGIVRIAAWLVLGAFVLAAPARIWSDSRKLLVATLVPVLALLLAPGLAGHASTQDPAWLLLPTDFIHLAGMSLWLGGLVALVFAVPGGTGELPPDARAGLLSACLARFSPLALASVAALAITGTIQAIIEVGSFPALVETGFGRAVLAKILIFAVLVVLGWRNRARLMPAIQSIAAARRPLGALGRRLRDNLRLEVVLIAVVLVASALLVGYAPSSDSAEGPISGTATLGDSYLEYTVEPGTLGANQIHLYLFDAEDGTQLKPREVTAAASLPSSDIGPLDIDLRSAGPGHYTAPSADFGIAGDWDLTVVIRTSRFDQDETAIAVPIR